MPILFPDKCSHVADFQYRFLAVAAQRFATQAQLHCPAFGAVAGRVMVRVLLQAHV